MTIHGVNKEISTDPRFKEYFAGKLRDIPKNLRSCEVIKTGWLMIKQIYCIEVPKLS